MGVTMWRWSLAVIACLLFGLAQAHLMPAQQGTVNLQGKAAFVVLSVPVSAVAQYDDNLDGRFSQQEMQKHRDAIEAQVQAGFQLFDADQALALDFIQASEEQHEAAGSAGSESVQAGAPHFLVLMKWSWARELPRLRLRINLFGKLASEQQFAIKILRDRQTDRNAEKQTEMAIMTPHHTSHVLFRAATEIFQDYLVLGVEHILTGWDHLLFLFTLIIATQTARSWRYWLAVLSSFTVAHSITLGLSLFGFLQPPVMAVEALIMLSIALMAGLNVLRNLRGDGYAASAYVQVVIVFACGLLHGFGFAAAMSAMGLHADYRSLSLLAFNLGIELGQILFLAVVLMAGLLLMRLRWLSVFVPRGRMVLNGGILALALWVFVLRIA